MSSKINFKDYRNRASALIDHVIQQHAIESADGLRNKLVEALAGFAEDAVQAEKERNLELEKTQEPGPWLSRKDGPFPYQTWCPFNSGDFVEIYGPSCIYATGYVRDFWWGYASDGGRVSDGVITMARKLR